MVLGRCMSELKMVRIAEEMNKRSTSSETEYMVIEWTSHIARLLGVHDAHQGVKGRSVGRVPGNLEETEMTDMVMFSQFDRTDQLYGAWLIIPCRSAGLVQNDQHS